MDLKPLELDRIPAFRACFAGQPYRSCDLTVGGVFLWRHFYKMEYVADGDKLWLALRDPEGRCFWNPPCGVSVAEAVETLQPPCPGSPLRFCTVPEAMLPDFYALGRKLTVTPQTMFDDYLYNAADLATLAGRRYAGQRNQIHQFERTVGVWRYEPLTVQNLPAARAFLEREYRLSENAHAMEREESAKALELLDHWDAYGFVGGVLLAGDRVYGFSAGEVVGDTLYVHVEKGLRDVHGVYQLLVREFAKRFAVDGVAYVNREDDAGDEGLRISKLSYHPCAMVKKYSVEISC